MKPNHFLKNIYIYIILFFTDITSGENVAKYKVLEWQCLRQTPSQDPRKHQRCKALQKSLTTSDAIYRFKAPHLV